MSAVKQSIRHTKCCHAARSYLQSRSTPQSPFRAFSTATPTLSPELREELPVTIDPSILSTPQPDQKQTQSQQEQPSTQDTSNTSNASNAIHGSRRRRHAIRTSQNIPFEKLPYQCFQEARKILKEDRDEKLKEIQTQKERIERLQAADVPQAKKAQQEHRIKSMQRHLDELKILADINDPAVKRTFEDGKGISSLPPYEYRIQCG